MAASSIPVGASGLGPVRGISTMLEVTEDAMRQATIGRNATPVIAGLKPRVCCM